MDQTARNAIGRLAEAQRGLFSVAQATSAGVSLSQLSRAARNGSLRRVRLGVYATVGTPPSRWEPMVAAALAAGPGAAISHSSAASVHGLHFLRRTNGSPGRAERPGKGPDVVLPDLDLAGPEITVPPPRHPKLPGVIVHRGALWHPEDLTRKHGLLITSPARTIIDMAARTAPQLLERSVDEALVARLLRIEDIVSCLERCPRNLASRGHLTELLSLRAEEPVADSLLETRIIRALKPLAPFETHYLVPVGRKTFVLDVAWPSRHVGAEIVGRSHRIASRTAFDRERRKLNVLTAAGWLIAHLTAVMSDSEILSAVAALLGRVDSGAVVI